MKKTIPASELILNPDGSIYHLNLHPEQVAPTVILVGDPDRVPRVSQYFDHIDDKVHKREFVTHTGRIGEKRLMVLSTGIGTDNIDIVMNELDALVNINLSTRQVKDQLTALDFIRIGTSGILAKDVDIDQLLISSFGIGLDVLLGYYEAELNPAEQALEQAFQQFIQPFNLPVRPTVAQASEELLASIGQNMMRGITLTCPGFYGPQGREIRLKSRMNTAFFAQAGSFRFQELQLTNFEMETSAIYGMARRLGHRAVSCNALIANRMTQEFSLSPRDTVDRLIREVLKQVVKL